MKCFVTNSTPDAHGFIKPGIPVQMNPIPHIAVGGNDRGGHLVKVPVTLRLASTPPCETDPNGGQVAILTEANPKWDEKGKQTIIVDHIEGKHKKEDRCLVHLFGPLVTGGPTDHGFFAAGYRGTCIWEVHSPDDQWAPIPYRVGGVVNPYDVENMGTLLVSGKKAQGGAGHMGHSAEHLVIMEKNTLIRFSRTGRTYGAPKVLLMMWDGENFGVITPDDLAAKSAQEALGKNPEQFKDL